MRHPLLFTILISSLCTVAFSQAPKKSNTIIIHSNLSSIKAYQEVISMLINEGYDFNMTDKENGIIQTNPLKIKDGNIKLLFKIKSVEDGCAIQITGRISIGLINMGMIKDDSWSRIENKGMKGSPLRNSWNYMEKISNSIEGNKDYLIQ